MPRNHRNPTAKKGNRKNKRSHFPKPTGVASTRENSSPRPCELSRTRRTRQNSSRSNSTRALYCNWPPLSSLVGGVDHFGKASALRLNPDLNFKILGNGSAGNRLYKNKKCASAHVGMRPKRNDAGTDPVVLNDGKRRAVVRIGWRSAQSARAASSKPDRKRSLEIGVSISTFIG